MRGKQTAVRDSGKMVAASSRFGAFDCRVHRGESLTGCDAGRLVECALQHPLSLIGWAWTDDGRLSVRTEQPCLPVALRCDYNRRHPLPETRCMQGAESLARNTRAGAACKYDHLERQLALVATKDHGSRHESRRHFPARL